MAGIEAGAVYVPAGRLSRSVMAEAWGTPSWGNERAVAAPDEDPVTMAVEAGRRALANGGIEPSSIGAVLLASTTAPYAEKMGAVIVAAALDVPDSATAAEFGGSLRCGLAALRAGVDSVDSRRADRALVVISEMRTLTPGTTAEQLSGDAAVALVVARDGALASVGGWGSYLEDVTARWRRARDQLVREFEPRLEAAVGSRRILPEVCRRALIAEGVEADQIRRAAIAGPEPMAPSTVAKVLGIPPGAVVQPLLESVGEAGAAAPFLTFCRALDLSEDGDRLLLAAWGDGAEAVVVTRGPARCSLVDVALVDRLELLSYNDYLRARALLPGLEPGDELEVSPVAYWRQRRAVLARYGGVCEVCGTLQYPAGQTCARCGTRRALRAERLSDRGVVFTFTNDHLLQGRFVDHPVTCCVVELEGGARVFTRMTDCAPEVVRLGMPVEMTFRRRGGGGGGFENYGWKCRPVRALG